MKRLFELNDTDIEIIAYHLGNAAHDALRWAEDADEVTREIHEEAAEELLNIIKKLRKAQ